MKRKSAILVVGTSATAPEIEYATGFRVSDPVVLMRTEAEQDLVVSALEVGRAQRVVKERATKKRTHVWTPEDLTLGVRRRRHLQEWCLGLLKRKKVRRVRVSRAFPVGIARRLEEAGIGVSVAEKDLFEERAIKTGQEIARIRESQQAAVIAMRAAIAEIESSEIDHEGCLRIHNKVVTAESIRRTITRVLLEHGCLSRDTIVAGGQQAADPHETGSGPLRAHEAIVIDIFPQHLEHGYWGDLTRTIVRGRPSTRLKRMYTAVKAAHGAALSRVKAGVNGATVHRAAAEVLRRKGFETRIVDGKAEGFIHGTGHGVGLSIHEAPSVSVGSGRLRGGNVITIEPGLYYPEIGGIRIEDTIVVTGTGWRYLVPCEKCFEV